MTTAKKAAAPARKSGSDSYVVSAGLIQVQVGSQVLQYSFGDVLPDGLSDETLEHLTENGLVRKGEVVSEPESAAE